MVELCESDFFVLQSSGHVEIPVRRSVQSAADITVSWRTIAEENSFYADMSGNDYKWSGLFVDEPIFNDRKFSDYKFYLQL